MNTNILLAAVGGQGLVLTTQLICEAAFKAGYDVKSNDVVGLSQRGGKVWGSVRIGEWVFSPNILPKTGDFLLGMEPLEGYRWSGAMKEGGMVILNTRIVPPVPVMFEDSPYPADIYEKLRKQYKLVTVDAVSEGLKIGSAKVANTILVGILAKQLNISAECWQATNQENVPPKFLDMNLRAFELGYGYNEQ